MSFILKRRDLCMYCGFNGIRQARTIRRLRALADGYRHCFEHTKECKEAIRIFDEMHGAAKERARIVADLRAKAKLVSPSGAMLRWAADAIERGEL